MTSEACCIKCQSRNVDGLCRRCGSPLVYLESTAGWYPQDDGSETYWDGEGWTGLRRPGSIVGRSPESTELPRSGSAQGGGAWLRSIGRGLKSIGLWVLSAIAVVGVLLAAQYAYQHFLPGGPSASSLSGVPVSCNGVESAAIKVSEEQSGSNSPFRIVQIKNSVPTTLPDAQNPALAQWALSGGLVYPTLKCDAVAVLADGTQAPVFIAVGSSAKNANDQIVGVSDRLWGDMSGLPFPLGTSMPSPAGGS